MKKNLSSTVATGIVALLIFHTTGFANCFYNDYHTILPGDLRHGSRNILVNDVRLSDEHVNTLERTYRVHIPDGYYWYDKICGAWGRQGGRTLGFTSPGLNLGGPLKANASNGNTAVFVNGRQLDLLEVLGLQLLLGVVWPGRFWVDAVGNYGFEGGMYLGNLWQLVRRRMATGAKPIGGPWATYAGKYAGGGMAVGDGQGFLGAQFGEHTWFN